MHTTIKNLLDIETKINKRAKIIAVSKTFQIDKILPLVDHGHNDFGENKVQEAIDKWTDLKKKSPKLNLHMIGKLQTNKVKFAVKLFDYIHQFLNEVIRSEDKSGKPIEYVKVHQTEKSGASLQITKKRGLLLKELLMVLQEGL